MVAPPAVVVTTPTRLAPAAGRNRHPRQQRQAFDQGVERVDPRDAASLEENIGDVVLAGERAGMGDRELARRRRAAELVGDDRFAALRRRQRKPAQAPRHAAWFRETACSRRCRDHRASPRRFRRARDRPRCRPKPGRRSRRRAPCRARAARRSGCRCGRRRRCARPASPARRRRRSPSAWPCCAGRPRRGSKGRRGGCRCARRSRAGGFRAPVPRAPVSAKPSASTVATLTPRRPHSSTASTAASVGVTI